MKLDIP